MKNRGNREVHVFSLSVNLERRDILHSLPFWKRSSFPLKLTEIDRLKIRDFAMGANGSEILIDYYSEYFNYTYIKEAFQIFLFLDICLHIIITMIPVFIACKSLNQ